jgi:transposase-like protein
MQRRKFSREFKLEAVRLIKDRGLEMAQAARDLDLHENVLRCPAAQALRRRIMEKVRTVPPLSTMFRFALAKARSVCQSAPKWGPPLITLK